MGEVEKKGIRLAIACDHGGLVLKDHLAGLLADWGFSCDNLGTDAPDSVDYPDYAFRLTDGILAGTYDMGILICGTGIGMSMAANRKAGIRAALCTSAFTARMARAHNDANVLCLGARVLGPGEAGDILKTFLGQDFEGGRHARRVAKFDSH